MSTVFNTGDAVQQQRHKFFCFAMEAFIMPVWFVMRNARAISEVVILFFRFSRASKSCRIFLVMDKVLKDFFEYDVTWGADIC